MVCARVGLFQANTHDPGPLQVAERHTLMDKPSKEVIDQAGWKTGKTPVRKLAPETHGAVGATNWCGAVARLDAHQVELRQRIKRVEVDHLAYGWLQETAERIVSINVADFAPSLLESRLNSQREMRAA